MPRRRTCAAHHGRSEPCPGWHVSGVAGRRLGGTWEGFLDGLGMLWWAVREQNGLKPQHVTADGVRTLCGQAMRAAVCVAPMASAAGVVWWCNSCRRALGVRLGRDLALQNEIGLNAECGVGKRWTNSDTTRRYVGGHNRATAIECVRAGFVLLAILDAPSPNVDDRVVQLGRFRTEREAERHCDAVWAQWDQEALSHADPFDDGFSNYEHA